MRSFIKSAITAIFLSMPAVLAFAESAEIQGQVFAVTHFGSIKLALAEIKIYRRDEIDRFLEAKRSDKDAKSAVEFFSSESAHADEADAKREAILKSRYMETAEYLMEGMPSPLVGAKSDADGRFKILAPSGGQYVIVAAVNWGEFGASGAYRWAVKVEAPASDIMLSSLNVLSSGSSESIISTTEDEAEIVELVKDGIAGLIRDSHAIRTSRAMRERAEAAHIQEARKMERQEDMESYRRNPSLAQKRAVEMYPALGIEGTPLHAEFLLNYQAKRESDPSYFNEPDWPIRLAGESVDSLSAKRKEAEQAP